MVSAVTFVVNPFWSRLGRVKGLYQRKLEHGNGIISAPRNHSGYLDNVTFQLRWHCEVFFADCEACCASNPLVGGEIATHTVLRSVQGKALAMTSMTLSNYK